MGSAVALLMNGCLDCGAVVFPFPLAGFFYIWAFPPRKITLCAACRHGMSLQFLRAGISSGRGVDMAPGVDTGRVRDYIATYASGGI